jgi:Fe-S-cluster-containing dehydrogenase component
MTTNRREFLKIAAVSALSVVVPTFTRSAWSRESIAGLTDVLSPGQALAAKRWGMVADLSKCRAGCMDCITACHAIHNVPNFGNPKDDVKWIWTEPFASVFPAEDHAYQGQALQKLKLPVMCNHCADPPCVRVCPTKATFQRPDGIVMMDYHRCIGCRFCMAACPYGARSMNYRDPRPFIVKINLDYPTRTKGVVEKCNFCEERLVRGLMPACVRACKQGALVFGDLEDSLSAIRLLLDKRFSLRRRAALGTNPQVYYLL